MKQKIGVIGLGFMGTAHARIYQKLKNCELVAICDTNPQKKHLAETYNCKFCQNSQDLLNQNIDAVSICTPTSQHKDTVIQALEKGKHVLVEKPFTDNITHAKEMTKKAQKTDRLLTVGYIERFNPALKKLQKIIKSNQIFSTVSTRFGPFPPRTKYSGVLLDLASHEIDILNHLTGTQPKLLYAHLSSKPQNNFEDYAYLSIQYNHIHSHIEASWLPNYKQRIINLYGNQKFYTLNYAQQKLKTSRAPPKAKIERGKWTDILWLSRHIEEEIPVQTQEPLLMELQCFIESTKQHKIIEPLCTPTEAIQVLKVTDEALNKTKNKQN